MIFSEHFLSIENFLEWKWTGMEPRSQRRNTHQTLCKQHLKFSFRDLNKLADGIGSKFGRLICSFSAFTAGYILGFCYLWKMTLVMLAVLPVIALSAGLLGKVMCKQNTTVFFNLIFTKIQQKGVAIRPGCPRALKILESP